MTSSRAKCPPTAQSKKFYSIFFKKSRSPETAPLVAPRKARNSPVVPSAIRRWRNPRPQAMVPAAAPCGGGRWGPYTLSGIQYCTPVRWGEYMQEGRHPPPATGWGRRPYGFAVGVAPSADGASGRLGISPAAAGDQRLCLWKPRFFEKKSSKTFNFGCCADFKLSSSGRHYPKTA